MERKQFRVRLKKTIPFPRISFLLIALLSIVLQMGAQNAGAQEFLDRKITLDIPQNTSLEDALISWGSAAGLSVLINTADVQHQSTKGIKGVVKAREALEAILNGSGLRYIADGNRIIVTPIAKSVRSLNGASETPSGARILWQGDYDMDKEKRLASSGGESATDEPTTTAEAAGNGAKADLPQVIVSAEKREERLQDVPVPVTVLSAESLVESNQLRLQDYYASVPGLTVLPADQNGAPTLAIRGITTGGFANPTVGIVIDDVPFGASTGLSGGSLAPDIDPSDLARVEVLRGPQGTLYGASSLGGLLKFVTIDPSTNGFSGRVQADADEVHSGTGAGYGFRAAVNVPLSDTLALRASGFIRQDPGYIDNPALNIDGINKSNAYGGHLSSLWKPSDTLTVKLSALYQRIKANGNNDVFRESGFGDLQQSYPFGVGAYDRRSQAYSLSVSANLGLATLTSLTGYSINTLADSYDYSNFLPTQSEFGVAAAPLYENNRTEKVTQEFRLSMPLGSRIDWLLGGFYTHERSPYLQQVFASDPVTGEVAAQWVRWDWYTTYTEFAGFTDLTFRISDQFDIQVGGRESQITQSYAEVDSGLYVPLYESNPSPLVFPEVVTHANAFTYLFTPRFRVSEDLMVYARLASGYRPGGPNPTANALGLPLAFSPDKTENYEVGVKGDAFARVLTFDASIYYIDWKNIQLSITDPTSGLSYYSNGSRAKSQGVEISLESKPLAGLTLGTWVSFNDAKLSESLPSDASVFGSSGDPLPFSSRFSGSFNAQQDFHITDRVRAFLGGAVSYVGAREGDFVSIYGAGPQRQSLPAYAKTDLRSGVQFASSTISVFVNNVADRRGALSGGLGSAWPFAFHFIQPRTVGISISRLL